MPIFLCFIWLERSCQSPQFIASPSWDWIFLDLLSLHFPRLFCGYPLPQDPSIGSLGASLLNCHSPICPHMSIPPKPPLFLAHISLRIFLSARFLSPSIVHTNVRHRMECIRFFLSSFTHLHSISFLCAMLHSVSHNLSFTQNENSFIHADFNYPTF